MKTDIADKNDIEKVVLNFYECVNKDELISGFFVDVNWEQHLPVMYNFWSDTLFGGNSFRGNPMAKHINLNKRMQMEVVHFERWLLLFNQTVDKLFEGPNSEMIKQRALSIATIMRIKISGTTT